MTRGRIGRGAAVAALALTVAACSGDRRGGPPQPTATARHAVLVTLDTVRADRIGAYGRADAGTPWMDALAARGLRFERAYAHVPTTLPSHVTMMTGLLPPRTGVHVNGQTETAPGVVLLAERLAGAGFRTVAAVGGFPVASRYPVARGFEVFDDRFVDRRNPAALERRADDVVDAALARVTADDSRPTFLWIHLFDPHDPYEPEEPFASRHPGDPYQGEIAAADAALARLAAALEPVLPASETVWCVVSDHGEALGEHGEPTHGFFLYEPTVRVPWIVAGPGIAEGAVETVPVGTVDVAPTLLAAVGVPVPGDLDGSARTGLTGDPGTAVYLETELPRRNYGWAPLHAVIDGRLKWIEAPQPELYDVVDDPDESFNQIDELPDEVARLRAALSAARGQAVDSLPASPDPRLSSLGYVGAVSSTATGLEDPKDRLATYVRFQEAARALEDSPPRPEDALSRLDALIAEDDGASVRLKRAMALRMLGRFDAARRDVDAARTLAPGDLEVVLEDARIAVYSGAFADALGPLSRYLDAHPDQPEAWLLRGAARERTGSVALAERDYRRALELNPGYRDASLRLAALLYRAQRFDQVRAVLRTHLRVHPGDPLAEGLLSETP